MINVTRMPFDPGPAAWNELLPEGPHYSAIEGACTADWLVVGAGFAGLSAARRLQQLHHNDRIVLIEARSVCEGPAGRNSGFMIDLPHNLASSDYAGALETDRLQTAMNRAAIAFARDAVVEHGFPAEAMVQSGKINAAATRKGSNHNYAYASHLQKLGEAHELLDVKQMQSICGSSYYESGLYTPGTAMLQPALYIRELARAVAKKGARIFENSPMVSLSKSGGNWLARTPGGTVEAPKVILAVNGHVESLGFFRRRLMHIYLYASMTRPLSGDEIARLGGGKTWAFTPADPLGTTVRKISGTGGTRIIVRNRFTWAPSRTVCPDKITSIARVHDRSFANRFPMLRDVAMEYRWGGLLCLSRNGVSAFGEVDENLYSACCQNGLGTAKGTMNGILAAELASGNGKGNGAVNRSKIANMPEHEQVAAFLDYMLNEPQPQKLPPEPFSSIGANAYMRWSEFTAGREL